MHADIAHPINSDCRNQIQAEVVEAYQQELERSKQPGYQPVEVDDLDVDSSAEVGSGSGYASLVAELKKDAEDRNTRRSQRGDDGAPPGAGTEATDDTVCPADQDVKPSEPPVDSVPQPAPAPSAADDDDFGVGIV